ncbi:MAG TPA: glucose 1-dehydrogenase [Acidimicrobiales bacterium]|jgi:3alpha(or 20beta)-hydroxysteroid dehydrogenase|nr:glucose 1-dehydrogenase [Acidimicrobiales bacterium]
MGALEGKTVIVTGSAQGMGRRHAERCVEEGARVVATDVQVAEGRAVVEPLGDAAQFVEHDVTDPAGWDAVLRAALDGYGSIDGLVNNAAVYHPPCLIDEEPFDAFERILRINVTGTWWGIRKVIEPMRANGGGSIVNISSIAGLRGIVGLSSYATSKWAVRGLTKSAANDLGPSGIRVNSVHPGGIAETGMYPVPQTAEERALRTGRVALRRPGTVDEVSSLVVFLLSDASSYITGVEHVIDGGSVLN